MLLSTKILMTKKPRPEVVSWFNRYFSGTVRYRDVMDAAVAQKEIGIGSWIMTRFGDRSSVIDTDKDITADIIIFAGSISTTGHIEANQIIILGPVSAQSVSCESIKTSSSIDVDSILTRGDVIANKLSSKNKVGVGGSLIIGNGGSSTSGSTLVGHSLISDGDIYSGVDVIIGRSLSLSGKVMCGAGRCVLVGTMDHGGNSSMSIKPGVSLTPSI